MTTWILLTIGAQILNAIVALIDKYIVSSGKAGRPISLVFYTGLLSSLAIVVFLSGAANFSNVDWPTIKLLLICFSAAGVFLLGLYYFFNAFLLSEASDVVPVISSVSAIATLIFSFYFTGSILSGNFLWGFCFLVLGTFLIAKFRMHRRLIIFCLSSGILFGLNAVFTKMLFEETNFDNAFFWSRVIVSFCALFLLLNRNLFYEKKDGLKKRNITRLGFVLIILNKTLAGIASILILKAIQLGDVSIIQALGGLQFVFLLIFAILIGHKAPKCIGENCELIDRIQKIISVSIIVTGFSLLFI